LLDNVYHTVVFFRRRRRHFDEGCGGAMKFFETIPVCLLLFPLQFQDLPRKLICVRRLLGGLGQACG